MKAHASLLPLLDGLVEGATLAIVPSGRGAWDLRLALPEDALVTTPARATTLRGPFGTVLDLAGFGGLPPSGRAAYARRLEGLVGDGGFLHVLCPSRRPGAGLPGGPTVPRGLVQPFGSAWTLLGVRDAWPGGPAQHAWLASFVRNPARGSPGPPVVRHFSDLGPFGSLDLGAAADRPPSGR